LPAEGAVREEELTRSLLDGGGQSLSGGEQEHSGDKERIEHCGKL